MSGNGDKQTTETHAERTREGRFVAPNVDIFESQGGMVLVADLPGVKKEDLTIDVEQNQLTLTARRTRVDEKRGQLVAGEFRGFDYQRAFLLSQDIDAEKITAELSNGVLRVALPKRSAAVPRKIEVRTN
jgi:HSP20 family molecular chaperone IbpA